MKVKQISVCQSCRSRKIGCDGLRPSCSQCVVRGRACPGYPIHWDFIQSTTMPLRQAGRQLRPSTDILRSERQNLPKELRNSQASYLPAALGMPEHVAAGLCAQHFLPEARLLGFSEVKSLPTSHICGAWIELLPALLSDPLYAGVVSPPIKVLASSIAARISSSPLGTPDMSQLQCDSLRIIYRTIVSNTEAAFIHLVAAVMCLFLAEMILPTAKAAHLTHVQGLFGILQSLPPSAYASGNLHRILLGVQPIIVVHCFITRKACFLGTDAWAIGPFTSKSVPPIQALLFRVTSVPGILQEVDDCVLNSSHASPYLKRRLAHQLAEVVNTLPLVLSDCFPNFSRADLPDNSVEWYHDIVSVNYMTHLWAFWLICVTQINHLLEPNELSDNEPIHIHGQSPRSITVHTWLHEFSIYILKSMKFLLNEEMRLFGPLSAVLPFQAACSFLLSSHMSEVEVELFTEIKGIISTRGFRDTFIRADS